MTNPQSWFDLYINWLISNKKTEIKLTVGGRRHRLPQFFSFVHPQQMNIRQCELCTIINNPK
ncbi:MAG: hypothetical protein DRP35_05980 [Candidatus Zixiibacteriota bacterium]|nr:MAG: hypothetical protein DRP35_05980 [candidate division Zixibacteria bacterium]